MTQNIHHQQIQQPQPGAGDYAERLVRVEKDVSGLKESMTALGAAMDRGFAQLAGEVKTRTAPNDKLIGWIITLALAGAGWGWALFGSFQSRTDAAIAEQKLVSARFVDRADINDKFQVGKEKNDLRQTMTDARIERIERDVEALSKQVVPRGEHDTLNAMQRMRDDGLQRQIDGLRKDLGDLNTPRDTIQAIQRRLDEFDRALRAPAGRATP